MSMSPWVSFFVGLIAGGLIGLVLGRKNYESCREQLDKMTAEMQARKAELSAMETEIDDLQHAVPLHPVLHAHMMRIHVHLGHLRWLVGHLLDRLRMKGLFRPDLLGTGNRYQHDRHGQNESHDGSLDHLSLLLDA